MKESVQRELEKSFEYVSNLVKALLANHENYFSNGYLNSEGWKIVNIIAKVLPRKGIHVQGLVRKIRANPSYDNVASTLNTLLEYLKDFRANHLDAE